MSSLFTELDKVYKALGGACFCQAAFVHGHKLNFLSNVGDAYESGLIESSQFQSLAATLIPSLSISILCHHSALRLKTFPQSKQNGLLPQESILHDLHVKLLKECNQTDAHMHTQLPRIGVTMTHGPSKFKGYAPCRLGNSL